MLLAAQPKQRQALWLAIVLIALGCAWSGYLILESNTSAYLGRNPDSFLRLAKILQLWEQGGWRHHVLERDNYPHGMYLQWTRLLDIMILAGALPLSLFMPFKQALLTWSFLLPPLGLAAQVALLLAVARRCGVHGNGFFYVALATVLNLFVIEQFHPRAVDHHFLLSLLMAACLLALLSWLDVPQDGRRTAMLAAANILGVWVAPEFLLMSGVTLIATCLQWVRQPQRYRHHLPLVWALVAAGLLLLLPTELRQWWKVRHDSLSIVHSVLFGLIAAALVLAVRVPAKNGRERFAVLAFLGLSVILLLQILFPGFYRGPMWHVSPLMQAVFLDTVTEYKPLWAHQVQHLLWYFLLFCGPAFAAMAVMLVRADYRRVPLVVLAAGSLLYVFFGVVHGRMAVYAAVFTVPLGAMAAQGVVRRLLMLPHGERFQRLLAVIVATAIVVLPMPFAQKDTPIDGYPDSGVAENASEHDSTADERCRAQIMTAAEKGWLQAILPSSVKTILADNNIGSFLLFYTPYNTVATNSHRNPGYLELMRLRTAEVDDEALGVIRSRRVDALLLCPLPLEKPTADTFLRRLQQDSMPPWLTKVSDPRLDSVMLFVVNKNPAG